MNRYSCYIGDNKVGVVEAKDSFEARKKAKEKFGEIAESAWNAKNVLKIN